MASSGDGTPSSTMVLTMVLSSPKTPAKQQDSSLMPLAQCMQAARHDTVVGGVGGLGRCQCGMLNEAKNMTTIKWVMEICGTGRQ